MMVLEVKNGNQVGSTLPPGVKWWNLHVTCSSLTPWGISGSLKRGPKVYFGAVLELTGHMFLSYPMGDFCVIEMWVYSILWPKTQLSDGPGLQKLSKLFLRYMGNMHNVQCATSKQYHYDIVVRN